MGVAGGGAPVGQASAVGAAAAPAVAAYTFPRRGRPLAAAVWNLSAPAIGESLALSLGMVLSLMIVGHLGPWALAAVGIAGVINWFSGSALFALGVGTTALVARATGSGDKDTASVVARQALMLSLGLGSLVALAGMALAAHVLRWMGLAPDVVALSTGYLRLALFAMAASVVAANLGAAFRGAGDTRTPFRIGAGATVVGLGLTWALVWGQFGLPALGLAGAGVGQLLAWIGACLVYLAILFRGRHVIRFRWSDRFRLDPDLIRRILRVGLPAAGEQLLLSGGMLMFTRLVATLGTEAFAAHQVALNITSLAFMTAHGFSVAAATLVGQRLGGGDPEGAQAAGWMTLQLGILAMLAIGLTLAGLGPHIARLYSTDPAVIAKTAGALRFAAAAQPAVAAFFVLAGALRGAGDTRWPMYVTFVGLWTIRLGLTYALAVGAGMGLSGVWTAVIVDQWTRAVLIVRRFAGGRWKALEV